ncbi:MAG: sensor histidine kinase [Methyloligellaceae bacterium]
MIRASHTSHSLLGHAQPGAIVPKKGNAGALLADYSLRIGHAVLRHRADVAERASRVEAELASKVKSEFIANVSHEFRTPLNAILGFSRILKGPTQTGLDGEQIEEYALFIHEAAEGLLLIVNDVITLSKIQGGKYDLTFEAFYADELLESCGAWARSRMRGRKLRFIEKIDDDLSEIRADMGQLKNVFERLLDNAITFTPAGGSIALFARRIADGRLMISISDTGVGMAPDEIETALKPFGQVDNRLDRDHGGAGLGLTIAKPLVELHGGFLRITSERGTGTDVVVVLPEDCERHYAEQKRRAVQRAGAAVGEHGIL